MEIFVVPRDKLVIVMISIILLVGTQDVLLVLPIKPLIVLVTLLC